MKASAEGRILKEMIEKGGTRPFILINTAVHPAGSKVDIPQQMLDQLPPDLEGEVVIYRTTLGPLQEAKIQLDRKKIDSFTAGHPVLVNPVKVEWLAERPQGGQIVEGDEEAARDGLCTLVVLATEIIRGCRDARDHFTLDRQVRRQDVLDEMKLPLSAPSCFKRGQAGLKDWFNGQKASAIMTHAYQTAFNYSSTQSRMTNLTAIEDEQRRLVQTAAAIYEKVLQFRNAQQAMSEAALADMPVPDAIWLELAHAMQTSYSIDEFTAAAIVMNFNPAHVFFNLFSFKVMFEIGIRLGRVQRGFGAWLSRDHVEKLAALIAQADIADAANVALVNDTERAARRLRNLAFSLKSRDDWQAFFDISRLSNQPLWMPPPAFHG